MYKIYCIIDKTNKNVYVGKTKQKYLSSRIATHKSHFKKKINDCSSHKILKNDNWSYKLLEDNLNEYEAKQREAYYIQNTENCINDLSLKYGRGGADKNRVKNYDKKIYEWQNSWGGGYKYNAHNNLLWIDVDLFKN